jgi:hypothetical protein
MTKENLQDLTNEELDNVVALVREIKRDRKAEAKEAEKARKEELKAQNKEVLEGLDEGATVRFTLKGEETEGTLDHVTEKRFVVVHDGIKKAVMFDKLIATE